MDIQDILSIALGIAKDKKFKIRIYETNRIVYEIKELTYLQLGTYLITNAEGIKEVRIYTKE